MSNIRRYFSVLTLVSLACAVLLVFVYPDLLFARGISHFKDTITNSAPGQASNHTFDFTIDTTVNPGAYIEISLPDDFTVSADSTFSPLRNVELLVDGVSRTVGPVQSASDDFVEITPGLGGKIRYKLNTTWGIPSGSNIELKIGSQTSRAAGVTEVYDSGLDATTTIPADAPPITNGSTTGAVTIPLHIYDGAEIADAPFVIFLVEQVGVGPLDTTELIPPERFNGAPTGTLPGTTFSVELSLETDEFAICHYSQTPGVAYDDMTGEFDPTFTTIRNDSGVIDVGYAIFHSHIVTVIPDSVNRYYVRCKDDEQNKNTDDFLIQFVINARPTGISNTEGSTTGDGTGAGNSGGGNGNGSGGTTGASSGVTPTTGGQTGGGGSGGGGGGGGGGGAGGGSGGGFETTAGPYQSGDAQVKITGFTAPRSTVTALVDGKIAQNTTADGNGAFTVTLTAIARGAYTFGIYSTDANKVKSSTFSTSFTVTGARESSLSNIFIAPTVMATPDPVNPGQTLTLSGYTVPNGTVTVENQKDGNSGTLKQFTAQANGSGQWSVVVDTTGYQSGTYKARAKVATAQGVTSSFSTYAIYGVGQSATKTLNSDLNRDGKVNLTDFSILLFWWNSNGGTSDPSADINGDAKVNLTDFSILLFNWTG